MERNRRSVPKYPVCPRCEKPVTREPHELRFQLVNGVPEGDTDRHGIFHHRCAADIWTVAVAMWRGRGVA